MKQHFCLCSKLTSFSKILDCFVTSLCIFGSNQIVAEAAQEVGVLQEVGVEHFDRNAAA